MHQNNHGFTIIEVVLFLAITSALFIVGFSSLSGRSQVVQFNDSIRSTVSFVERRYAAVQDGSTNSVNQNCQWNEATGGYTAAPSDGTCIFLGYLFRFNPAEPSQIEVYQTFGGRLPSSDPCYDTNEPLECVYPTISPGGGTPQPIETYDIPWDTEIAPLDDQYNVGTITYFGYLRNPTSQNIFPVMIEGSQEGRINDPSLYATSDPNSRIGDEFSLRMCLTDGSRVATVWLGISEKQNELETYFDDQWLNRFCRDRI